MLVVFIKCCLDSLSQTPLFENFCYQGPNVSSFKPGFPVILLDLSEGSSNIAFVVPRARYLYSNSIPCLKGPTGGHSTLILILGVFSIRQMQ